MRWMIVGLIAFILVLPLWANPGDGAKFSYDSGRMQLAQAMSQSQEQPAAEAPDSAATTPVKGKLVPGKAILLSAILPGAGQYYGKNPVMAGVFLALEAGALAGVWIYNSEGMSLEDEYMKLAADNWVYGAGAYVGPETDFGHQYVNYEYWAATNFGNDNEFGGDDVFTGDIQAWMEKSWAQKLSYLPSNGFTHELDPNDQDQQYYEMIGKYDQFAPGWPDYIEDDATTWQTNASITQMRDSYLTKRKDSNDALDMSKNFTMVVLGNHLLSALHAGFNVSRHNKKLAKEQNIQGSFQLEPRQINNQQVAMGVLQIKF